MHAVQGRYESRLPALVRAIQGGIGYTLPIYNFSG